MKVLFAVSNESISENVVKTYQKEYKEIISYKNVYYFNAILKEIQKEKTYDRIVISEDLEPFANNNYDAMDKFIFDKLDSISDEATNNSRSDTPIILICSDRREKSDDLLVKLFSIGIYDAVIGQDRVIGEICNLIKKPRTKKEAKMYYKIDTDEVNYQSENENEVSEVEIQNILNHYKKIGKNEEKYVESFDNIASQYSDTQLKLIANLLPLNVKAVLEEKSPKYQKIMTGTVRQYVEEEKNTGIKMNFIGEKEGTAKIGKNVVIPSEINKNKVKKVNDISNIEKEETEPVEEKPKRRGRPKKVVDDSEEIEEKPKRRGRPKKVVDDSIEEENSINLFEMAENNNEDERNDDNTILPGIEDSNINGNEFENTESKEIIGQQEDITGGIENLLSQDKKLVSFVGTSKNGTSFLVNNIAQQMSSMGIKTAILDATKNRNAYYIYTKNEENLRTVAAESIKKLTVGIAQGIPVNNNLTVFTAVPEEDVGIDNYKEILETLVQNYSLVLIDCDFNTNMGYFADSQEIYLVQSLDVLTIQPLTAFLRDLKAKLAFKQEKLRIVINKNVGVRGLSSKTIIGGMSYYNEPSMSFMTELFNRDLVKYCVVPFEAQTYSRYLEGLVDCKISLSGYSKQFIQALKSLANMVYPLIANKKGNKPTAKNEKKQFSSDMNTTLNQMKKNY